MLQQLLGGGQPQGGSSGGRSQPVPASEDPFGMIQGLSVPQPFRPALPPGQEPDLTWGEASTYLDLLDDPGLATLDMLRVGPRNAGFERIVQEAASAFREDRAYESPYGDASFGERLAGGMLTPFGGLDDAVRGVAAGARAIPGIVSGAGDVLGAIRSGDDVMQVLSDALRNPATRRNPDSGGFSRSLNDTEVPAGGFAVGGVAPEVNLPTTLIGPETVDAYRATNAEILEQPGALLGGWLNAEDGRGYLDVSRVIPDRETALQIARDTNQLAIWDIANKQEIATGIQRGAVSPIEAARFEAASIPATITGHPRFDVIRRDVETLTALGFDPTQWERAGGGMVLPRPQNATSDRTYDAVRAQIEANRDTTLRMFQAGADAGATRWYDNQEILDLTNEAFDDPVVARTMFDMLMEVEGVASAGSTVPQQTARASWLWYQLANGVPPSSIQLTDLPRGLGNMTWSTSQGVPFSRFDQGASPFSADALKTGNYTGNLQGQGDPFTADRWMPRMMLNTLENRTTPPPTGVTYTAFADAAAEFAQELGVTPRDFQAAVWVGAGTVMNPESFRQVFINGLRRYADQANITLPEATRRFYVGEAPISHIMGMDTTDDLRRRAARMLAQASSATEEEEGSDPLSLIQQVGGF